MGKEKYKGRRYSVQEYDPNWVTQYETEVNDLESALGSELLSVEHVGSTSVPGLAGKPTVDILAVVQKIEQVEDFIGKLESLGYKYLGQYVMEGSRLFAKEENNTRLVDLHFYHQGHVHIDEMLDLRDYFRTHPEAVKEYTNLKFDLINKYPDDYGSYREHKDKWMNALKAKVGLNYRTA